ncbi:MAG: zinc-ribbon domain-containing protein [Oscillospiraceae bacterium]|nr:zinc-ribbon domain-containing protein [Oscillospiraceae bacterium]
MADFDLNGKINSVVNSVEKLAKGAADTSKRMVERVKVKSEISKAESDLNAAYIELGKKYEELYGDRMDADFADVLARVAKAKAAIAVSRAELASIDSASVCPNCGKFVKEGDRFCPNCGTKQCEPACADAPCDLPSCDDIPDVPAAPAPTEDAPAEDAPKE